MKTSLTRIVSRSLFFLFLLSFTYPALATTVVIPSDDNMVIGARAIVKGKVVSIGTAYDEERNWVYTYVTVKVREVLKGEITERRIVLKELGGEHGDHIMRVFGSPQFRRGENVLLYLDTWPDGSLRTHHMFLGKFNITRDPNTGGEVITRSQPDENTQVLEPHLHGASAGNRTERMDLSGYLQMVRERVAANRGRSDQFEQENYAGVAVKSRPADFVERGKQNRIQPQYTLLGGTGIRWFEADNNQPVIATVKPNGAPVSNVMSDMQAAMSAWSNIPNSSLRVESGGTANGCYVGTQFVGIALVFDNCDGKNSVGAGCDGTLAWGGFSATRSGQKVINGTPFYQATQGFVSFNPSSACYLNDHCQLQEVATHELGHALGLGHSQSPDATMAASAHFDGRCASVRADDIAGISFIYPGTGGGGGGPLSISTVSALPVGTTGVAYLKALAASGGTAPYSWRVLSGTLPPGLTLQANGNIAGVPTAAGSYAFTVQVADARSTTAQRDFSITVETAGNQYNARFVSQSVPAKLQPGQQFQVTLRWDNTGTQSWNGSAGFRLASQNPPNNVTWGGDTVIPAGLSVNPGQQMEINFTALSPGTPGTYNFQWQLVQNNVFFGEISANVAIQVGDTTPEPVNDAQFVSQQVSSQMTAGQAYNVSVTMRNSGTTTWAAGQYRLGSQNPQDNTTWGTSRVNLIANVAPGAQATFSFAVTAPAAPGSYNFQWRMLKEGTGYFGGVGQNASVLVVQPVAGLEITTASLAAVQTGSFYSQQLAAKGGAQPYSWSLKSGALPVGLALEAGSGRITGTPTTAGSFTFTVQVTDGASRTAEKQLSITVTSPVPPLSIVTSAMPSGLVGRQYRASLGATGGTAPYTWAMASGVMPEGLSLDPQTGVISGTPTSVGTFNVVIVVRDQHSLTAQAQMQMRMMSPLPPPTITNIKYKAKKKMLIVSGLDVNTAAALVVDGVQVATGFNNGSIKVKGISLLPGLHQIRVINPGGLSSEEFDLYVN